MNNYVRENNVRCIYVRECFISPEEKSSILMQVFYTRVRCLVDSQLKMRSYGEICDSKSRSITVFQDV